MIVYAPKTFQSQPRREHGGHKIRLVSTSFGLGKRANQIIVQSVSGAALTQRKP